MQNLEKYLRECSKNGIIDHCLRSSVDDDGNVSFYIHADSKNSETLDFTVLNNLLLSSHIKIVSHGDKVLCRIVKNQDVINDFADKVSKIIGGMNE